MESEWIWDDHKGNHLLCIVRQRCLFFRGTLSSEKNGKRVWQPFPEGEPQEVAGDLQSAKEYCEGLALSTSLSEHVPLLVPSTLNAAICLKS